MRKTHPRKRSISFRVDPDVWNYLASLPPEKSPHEWAHALLLRQLSSPDEDELLADINARLDRLGRGLAILRAPLETILLNIASVQASLSGMDEDAAKARFDEAAAWLREHFGEED